MFSWHSHRHDTCTSMKLLNYFWSRESVWLTHLERLSRIYVIVYVIFCLSFKRQSFESRKNPYNSSTEFYSLYFYMQNNIWYKFIAILDYFLSKKWMKICFYWVLLFLFWEYFVWNDVKEIDQDFGLIRICEAGLSTDDSMTYVKFIG